MKYNWMLPVALFAMGSVFADDVIDNAYIAEATRSSKDMQKDMQNNTVAPQYDNRFGFSYNRLVYERTKNDDVYFGLDVWAGGWVWNHTHNRHYASLFEAEARIGYNLFYNGQDHFTPLVGAGYLYNNVNEFHRGRFAYATAGFKYLHEFNTVFGWGLDAKGLVGQQVSKTEEKKVAWGVDLSMPFVFRFAHMRRWDITLEPGYLYIESNHKHSSVFLGRGTLAYRF